MKILGPWFLGVAMYSIPHTWARKFHHENEEIEALIFQRYLGNVNPLK